MKYKFNVQKFVIVLISGLMLLFAFLIIIALQLRGTNVTMEYFDRIFYLFFVLIIILSITGSIEKTKNNIQE